jgi:death-on-curing protein
LGRNASGVRRGRAAVTAPQDRERVKQWSTTSTPATCSCWRPPSLGVEAYDTLWLKASALLDSIVRTRPLAEGNWRLGWVAAVTLCDINGWWIDAEEDEALDLVRALGREQMDVGGMAAHLEAWGVPKGE